MYNPKLVEYLEGQIKSRQLDIDNYKNTIVEIDNLKTQIEILMSKVNGFDPDSAYAEIEMVEGFIVKEKEKLNKEVELINKPVTETVEEESTNVETY